MIHHVIQAMNQLAEIKSVDSRFDFPCPVCWFGNLDTKKPLILTMGINPSDKDFLHQDTGFKCFRGLRNNSITPQSIIDAFNNYFHREPYTHWFNAQQKLLCPLNASYYNDVDTDYQLVHIDLFPFATSPKWAKLSLTPQFKSLLFDYGLQLIADIIAKYEPKLILSFGGFNDKVSAFRNYWRESFSLEDHGKYPKNDKTEKLKSRKIATGTVEINKRRTPIIFSTAVVADANRINAFDEHMNYMLDLAKKVLAES